MKTLKVRGKSNAQTFQARVGGSGWFHVTENEKRISLDETQEHLLEWEVRGVEGNSYYIEATEPDCWKFRKPASGTITLNDPNLYGNKPLDPCPDE